MKNIQGNGKDFPNLMETEELDRLHRRAEALCRDRQRLMESSAQTLRQETGDDGQLFAEASDLMQQMQMLLLEYDFKVKDMESALENSACEKQALEQQNVSLEASNEFYLSELNRTRESLMSYESGLMMVTHSASWKLTAPLRGVKRWLRRAIGRAARRVFRLAKGLYGKKARVAGRLSAAGNHHDNWPPRIREVVHYQDAQTAQVHCRRLGIYTIFDKDGVVDGYILYFLKALSEWTDRLIVVCNGSLNAEGHQKLEALGCEVLYRENAGFDAWGVKCGIDHVGFEELKNYDELIVANNTLFGPVGDMTAMFETMAAKKLDFWGIASHEGFAQFDPFGCNPYGYIPEHIQSYFYVVRSRMLHGDAFASFWSNLPQLNDYNAAVGMYETVMTRYFSDAGYAWDCYMDRELYYGMTDNPLIAMPMESMRDWNCPFFKRRAFFQDYDYITSFTGQQSASCLLQYLEEETQYPVSMVWENLIRTCHMSDLVQNLHLARIFERENCFALSEDAAMRSALFMHIYDHTMAEELAEYASAMPADADIYISTVSEERKAAILKAFGRLPNCVEVRVLPNRGRDVSALLASFKDVVMNYDVACVTHDKKTGYLKPQTVGEGFAYMGYENILGGSTFVRQVLQAFAEDPHLGLLYAPDPNHADFATHIGLEWGANFACTKQLAQTLKLHVPMDEKHPPMAPFGSSFWFRTKAMVPLFAKDWTYEDFPPEPFNMTDGSILHAIERIYPYVAQHAGYYSAMLATADYASVDIGNLYYYAQGYAHVCYDNGISNRFNAVRDLCNMAMGSMKPEEGIPVAPAANRSARVKFLMHKILSKARMKLARWANE